MRAFVWGFLSLALAVLPATAAPAGVYFVARKDWNEDILGAAIKDGFAKANIPLMAAPSQDVLIALVPDGLEHDGRTQAYKFTVEFYWHGSKLGESDESCNDRKLPDCVPQLILDTRSALSAAR